ncbi:MAG: hypothetical protein LBC70_09725 [Chitinispirillales bacterium]|nr:hypothetical protein [Chitinispirillales bacterium]
MSNVLCEFVRGNRRFLHNKINYERNVEAVYSREIMENTTTPLATIHTFLRPPYRSFSGLLPVFSAFMALRPQPAAFQFQVVVISGEFCQ